MLTIETFPTVYLCPLPTAPHCPRPATAMCPTKYYPLHVRDLRRETADTVICRLRRALEELRDLFQFVQGQYLTLRTVIDG